MDQLRLRFLGVISVDLGRQERHDQLSSKTLALLSYLAVTGEAQTRGVLASLLWSDFPEHRARGNLRDTLASLRRTPLAPYVDIGRRMVSFNWDLPCWLDTAAFQQGVEQGIKALPDDPSALEAAVALYRGEFLAGFQVSRAALFEEWVTIQRQRMHLLAIEALQQLVDFHLDAGNYETGIPHASRLLILDPWREQTHRNLMLLLLLNGEYNAALKQYEQCRQIMADELGVDPSEETQTLYQNIRKQINNQNAAHKIRLAADESPQTSPPFSPNKMLPNNLPGQITPFIGREKEQRAIDNVLRDRSARLITIFGVGGSGKTRLALAVGEKQIQTIERDGRFRFPDGVFFVPLEAVETPTGIVPAICHSLGFQPADEDRTGRSIERQLLDYLRRKQLLLIIDNFEQLLAGVGLLAKIHRSTTVVQLLVTSRQKLALQGERLYALEGLRYPKAAEQVTKPERLLANYSAAALFVASARRVQPDFQLYDEEAPALIHLCRLVDGLPLAVELAASWTNVLSLDDIVAEIEQGLSFLESDLHDLPDRHRNMEAVFEVSWRRLAKTEQAIFAQLCVFRGGFTRQAAEMVMGATLRQLAMLVNKALIQYDRKLDRYQVHRLLHQFGADKLAHNLAVENAVRNRHCSFYSAALQQWNRQLKGTEQLAALSEFDKESANMRSAWYFAAKTGQFAELDRAADGLGRFYLWRRRFHEGKTAGRLAEESLLQVLSGKEMREDAAEIKRVLAKIRIWLSIFCERAMADELIEQALRILDSPELSVLDTRCERAFGLQRAGDLAFGSNADEARRFYRRSLTLYRKLDDAWGVAKVLTELGWEAAHHGETGEAQHLGEEALSLVRATGDRKRTADILWLLGTLAILQGQVEESSRLLGESLDIRETLGDRITDIAAGPLDLGMTLTWIGRMAEADAVREEALVLYEAQGQPEQIALAHVRLATSKVHIGQLEAVERHARIGLGLCRSVGNQRGAGLALWVLAGLSLITGEIDEADLLLRESLAIFRKIGGAAEIGWVLGTHAAVVRRQGQPEVAKRYVYDALHTASGVLGLITLIFGLTVYIDLLVDEGQENRALEMGALLERYPMFGTSLGIQSFYDGPRLAAIRAALPPEVVAEAEARGRARDLQETAAEILVELEEVVKAQRQVLPIESN